MLRSTLFIAVSVVLAACGSDSSHKLADACVTSGSVTASVTGPTNYACMAPFKATVTVVNNSCDPVNIQGVTLSATAVGMNGTCDPPASHTYQPAVNVVEPGQTTVVLDLTGGAFCCLNQACPANFTCAETYTYTVVTGGTALTATNNAELDLGSCGTICQ